MKELSLHSCRLDKRYDVIEQLGRGSYAEIFLARDSLASPRSVHSTVVIKALNVFLHDDLDPDLERTLVENFENEALALDRVRHPNIISRLGHGTARDLKGTVFHYLVLEYMSGGDLQSLIRNQPMRMPRALAYLEQVCAGLGHAHRNSVIHRDIKPQNLLLNFDRSIVKIADFGVARVHVSDAPITRVGTNAYAPPEHSPLMAGRTGDLDSSRLTPAADIYSLAKTFYAMVTGVAPRAFVNEAITSLPETIDGEPWIPELLRVLERATASDPQQRHLSVDEFWSDLAGVREAASEEEFETVLHRSRSEPQPQITTGYSPLAPDRPSFEAVAQFPSALSPPPIYIPPQASMPIAQQNVSDVYATSAPQPRRKRRTFRRLAGFLILVLAFTGLLYGTASFVRNRMAATAGTTTASGKTGVASTDVYLRPSPNTDNDPIGLVTKNSKVRIVNSQNNWYQVDVVEQGRDNAPSPGNAKRGWLNGKYLELANN